MKLPFITSAWAQANDAPGSAAAAPQPSLIENMVPMLIILVAMYFILIRPQSKKAKEHATLLKALKVGDEVITSGGIIGRVKSLADEFVTLETGSTQLKVVKEHISRYTRPAAEKAKQAVANNKKA